ncbi:MAG: carbohydrate kinase [Chitinophagaceae bacterium]|nr:MAG: carbohydrate kinase [Chitinophagaceae bacterium]
MKQNKNTPKVACFGEVLWDMLPGGKRIGGAPLNVAYHLNKLGTKAAIISRVGQDEHGNDIVRFINQSGIEDSVLQVDAIHSTSHVEVTINEKKEATYDIINNVAWDFIDWNEAVNKIAAEVEYIVFGSLVMRSKVSGNTLVRLLNIVPFKIFDVNLRTPFYSREIIQILLEKTDIVKMNEEELKIISQWFYHPSGIQESMESLLNMFSLKNIIVTSGAKGAHLQSKDHYLFVDGYKVTVVDTVGSGDAFLAGFISQFIRGAPLAASLEIANKMGTFIAQKPGGCPDYTLSEMEEFKINSFNQI